MTVTADTILDFLKEAVASKKNISRDVWLDAAFKLNLLALDEQSTLETLRSEVAQLRLSILKSQEKRNVAAADLEVEATEDYRKMRIQEHKCDRIIEFIRIAKKNADY